MHDSVLRIEQVVTELGNRDVPIRFAELFAAEKNPILRMVTEDVAMISVVSDAFVRYIQHATSNKSQVSFISGVRSLDRVG